MANLNVFDILSKVYGPRGIPFPGKPLQGDGSHIANGFAGSEAPAFGDTTNSTGRPVKKVTDASLGRYTFMPVTIDGYEMPNPIIIISGEKMIVETDVIDVGTVFEKVFEKPYDISIICTVFGDNDEWPEQQLTDLVSIWKKGQLVTLECALTDLFIQSENNFIISKIAILDNSGAENVEVVQIDGKSNKYFELIIR